MDTEEEEIRQEINMHLTEEIAEKLNMFLDKGAQAHIDLTVVEDDNAQMRTELERLKDLEGRAALVAKQKDYYEELQRGLDKRVAIADVVAKERAKTENQIFELARIAFDNPKLKFQGYVSSYSPDGGNLNANIDGGETTERN